MKKSNINAVRFGRDIKKAREEKGASQIEYAKEFQKYMQTRYGVSIRISQEGWAYYETGARVPNLARFYDLCAYMDLKPADYMDVSANEASEPFGAFDKDAFRAALLDTRREHSLTKDQAAEKSNIPPSVYERIEATGIANIHNYAQICAAFALDPNDYLYIKK